MAERYRDGATVYELAAQFNVRRSTVSERLKKVGVQMRGKQASSEDIAEFVTLYESGQSIAKIAQRSGFSDKTVHTYLRREGVRLRDTHGRERTTTSENYRPE